MATSTWFCFSGLGQVMGQKSKAGIVAIRGKDLTQENRETTFEMGGLSSLAWHGMLPPAWRSVESRTTRGNLFPAIRTQAQLAMPHKHRRLTSIRLDSRVAWNQPRSCRGQVCLRIDREQSGRSAHAVI